MLGVIGLYGLCDSFLEFLELDFGLCVMLLILHSWLDFINDLVWDSDEFVQLHDCFLDMFWEKKCRIIVTCTKALHDFAGRSSREHRCCVYMIRVCFVIVFCYIKGRFICCNIYYVDMGDDCEVL